MSDYLYEEREKRGSDSQHLRVVIRKGFEIAGEDDCELVHLAQQGAAAAFDQLILRHQDGIARQMHRFAKDAAVVEDLTQTVFVKAYMGLGGYNASAPFAHWLKRIASRVGYDYWREEYKKKSWTSFDEARHGTFSQPSGVEEVEPAGELLSRVMERLKPEERQTLYLVYIDGMSLKEAAKTMGWSVAMTKMRSYRARKKLRKILEAENIDVERYL